MLRLASATSAPGVLAGLRARGIHADARGTVLRLSPGIVTTDAGTERLIQALAGIA